MFLSKLKHCINIYDIMILSFEQIKDESIVRRISDYDPREYNYYAGLVSQYVEESETSTINAMSNLVQNIEFAYQKRNFGFYEFFTIITTIDKRCQYDRLEVLQGEFDKFEGINTLHEFGANVIPIIKNTVIEKYDANFKAFEKASGKKGFGLRKRQKLNIGDINDHLENYIIIKDLPYKINVFSLSKHFNFFKKTFDKNIIDIVSVPMMNSETNKIFNCDIDGNNIRITGIKDECRNQIKETYKSSLTKDARSDLLIFPELFFTDMDLDEVCETVSNVETENDGLIVLGSYCKDGANKCVIITSNGTVLFEQHKKTNYVDDGKYEDLSKSDNVLNLMDVEGVGRICVVVCKDILNDDIKRHIKILNVDILIIVSYSSSLDMKSASEELAKACRCISIMCNSCSSIKIEGDYKKIGYIVIPAKQETYSEYHTEFYTNEQCSMCKICAGHRINIKYDEINLYNDNKIGAKIYKTIEK